jgi:hypothetical protein
VQLGENDIDIRIDMNNQGGDAIYFRVVDNSNWWRLRYYGNQGTGTQYCNIYEYRNKCNLGGCDFGQSTAYSYSCGSCPNIGSCCGNSIYAPYSYCCAGSVGCSATGTVCGSQACGTYNYDEWRFYLEKCVAGTITTVQTSSTRTTASTAMRVVALGTSITGFRDAGVQLFNATDATHQNATKHGIGRGPTGNRNGQGIDNFNLVAA